MSRMKFSNFSHISPSIFGIVIIMYRWKIRIIITIHMIPIHHIQTSTINDQIPIGQTLFFNHTHTQHIIRKE